MIYKYLYQDRNNQNCAGEIKAKSRAEAYLLLRKQKIRPYRVIGDDPVDFKPWLIGFSYAILLLVILVLALVLVARVSSEEEATPTIALSAEEGRLFRQQAEESLAKAPAFYRYTIWKGLNARLQERGLDPLPRPDDLMDE